MKSAIIKTGGKQYLVAEGDSLKIEKLADEQKEGDKIVFGEVLLSTEGDNSKIGTPTVSGAEVHATVEKIGRHPKILVVKYKQKSRYMKRNGHRQLFVQVKIDKIA
ncbi:MAG TPA: 50S ribosomal protein L21 [Candidatus Paceibacterota bacterium]|nr:50S ribosomal protein L21 [Candidatus Paceibacterota bacterium]